MSIFTPTNQKLLTNVVVVRLKKGGKRFEVACYPNKVMSWRQGVEKNLDEVLQMTNVFTNVAKGEAASKKDLHAVFETDDSLTIIKEILSKGELQISERERKSIFDSQFRDIVHFITQNCVDPKTRRPLTSGMVERSLKECHYSLKPQYSAKQQALDAIRILSKSIPICRALMRLRVTVPEHDAILAKSLLRDSIVEIESEDNMLFKGKFTMVFLADPSAFRLINGFISNEMAGNGTCEVVNTAVVMDGETKFNAVVQWDNEDDINQLEKSDNNVNIVDNNTMDGVQSLVINKKNVVCEDEKSNDTKAPSSAFGCNTCSVDCVTAENRRNHFKTEWHTYNLRRKVEGFSELSDEEYKRRLSDGTLDSNFDNISLGPSCRTDSKQNKGNIKSKKKRKDEFDM